MINKRQRIIEVLTTAMEKPEIANALIQRVINELNKPQPEPEPVAWTTDVEFDDETEVIPAKEKGRLGTSMNDIPLYTAPPQREWVGLTDEEEAELDEKYGDDINVYIDQRDLRLKEKNT